MSDDGWGSAPVTQPAKPAPAAGGAQSGFGSQQSSGFGATSKPVGPAGDAPAKSSGFGSANNGFGSSSAQNKSTGFGSGAGFGAAAATGGSNATPSAGFGGGSFGSAANSGSSSVSKPAGFGSFGSAGGGSATTQSNGFGASKPSGFGAASAQPSNDAKPSGFGGSSGFGAKSGSEEAAKSASGFGNASGGSNSGGFGAASKPSGFGSSGGFGSAGASGGASSGFGSGGGFGASSGGSTGFGSSSGFGGGFGASGGSSGFGGSSGGGGMNCYNCNKEGHRANECTEPKKSRGCHNCGQEGHMSRECPEPRKPRDGARTGGGFGASSGGSGFGGAAGGGSGFGGGFGGGFGDAGAVSGQSERPRGCYNCGEEGHRSADCTQPRKERPANGTCYNCGQEGHRSNDCTEPPKPREDGAKPASTFIPEEDAPEALYNAGVEKGTMFERFFEAAVTTTLGGLEGEKKETADVYERFDQFGLGDKILQNINQSGFSKPTPVQQHAMPVIMAGNDLLACAQTGSGKTAAFLLPVMSKLIKDSDMNDASELGCFPRCVIIAPTRELAVQIYNESRKLANGTILSSCVVYGGTHVGHQRNQLLKGATIVVGTTGRLNQFIQDGTISLDKVKFLILDEADRMLDMGFGEDITRITQHATIPSKKARQTLMFSATFPTDVQTAARQLLKDDYVMVTIDSIGAANKCITQEIIKCDQSQKKDKLLELLNIDIEKYTVDKKSDVFNKKTLIFVSKKSFADTLGAIVSSSGLPATTIHGDRLQNERHEAMRDFASGRKAVMIATAVAERGLDIKGVDHVINYDLPEEIDQYVHRIGRTGRVGNSGRATSLYTDYNQKIAQGLLKCMADAGQIVPDWLESEASGCGSGDGGSGFGGGFSSTAPINQEEEW